MRNVKSLIWQATVLNGQQSIQRTWMAMALVLVCVEEAATVAAKLTRVIVPPAIRRANSATIRSACHFICNSDIELEEVCINDMKNA